MMLSIVSLFFLFKSSEERTIFMPLAEYFQQFSVGNSIIFNLSLGWIVSATFYFLVVLLPEVKRNNLIKSNFKLQYREFKLFMIMKLLDASDETYTKELSESLMKESGFKLFFNKKVNSTQSRWHVVRNNLDEQRLVEIQFELEIIKDNINYVLNNMSITDREVFTFLHGLNRTIIMLKSTNLENDNDKELLRFLWDLFTGFSINEGYRDYDLFELKFTKL